MGGEGPNLLDYVGHSLHALVVIGGIVAVVLLLAPPRRAPQPMSAHDLRVALLRERVAAGGLVTAEPLPSIAADHAAAGPARVSDGEAAVIVAAVASAAAAGVHAAVTPAHLGEGFAVGLFFLLTALIQSAWACALMWKPERPLLAAGIVGNAALVLVWMMSRTTGIPTVADGRPEAVGLLDLAAVTWELALIACCVRLLSQPGLPCPSPSWHRWPFAARCWLALSVSLLGALTFLDLHT